jgi:hypothetical protein
VPSMAPFVRHLVWKATRAPSKYRDPRIARVRSQACPACAQLQRQRPPRPPRPMPAAHPALARGSRQTGWSVCEEGLQDRGQSARPSSARAGAWARRARGARPPCRWAGPPHGSPRPRTVSGRSRPSRWPRAVCCSDPATHRSGDTSRQPAGSSRHSTGNSSQCVDLSTALDAGDPGAPAPGRGGSLPAGRLGPPTGGRRGPGHASAVAGGLSYTLWCYSFSA